MYKKISVVILAIAISAISGFAQNAQLRSTVAGQKYKIKGTIVSKDDTNTFVVRDATGVDTRVIVEPNASVRSKGGFFSNGDKYPLTSLVRGAFHRGRRPGRHRRQRSC
jgi:hypothetical protein